MSCLGMASKARLLSPQDVISSGLPLTWRITHSTLQRSLRSLHAELISHRTRLLETDCSKRNHVLITSLVGSAERNIQDGPCRYLGDDDVLALGSCRIVTAPAVTGVMLSPKFFCGKYTSLRICTACLTGMGQLTLTHFGRQISVRRSSRRGTERHPTGCTS
jgi:hypothetical protein